MIGVKGKASKRHLYFYSVVLEFFLCYSEIIMFLFPSWQSRISHAVEITLFLSSSWQLRIKQHNLPTQSRDCVSYFALFSTDNRFEISVSLSLLLQNLPLLYHTYFSQLIISLAKSGADQGRNTL